MPTLLPDPPARLRALLSGAMPRVLVALAGLPGSGKSTRAAHLAAEVNATLGPGTASALGMDGFHLPLSALRLMPDPDAALARRGAPWTFDAAGLASRLRRLREAAGQERVPWPEFRHETGDPANDALWVAPETRLVLVEGLYLLKQDDGWAAVSGQFDERWYLDTPEGAARARLLRRHQAVWGLSAEEADARIAANDALNAALTACTRPNADFLLPDVSQSPPSPQ